MYFLQNGYQFSFGSKNKIDSVNRCGESKKMNEEKTTSTISESKTKFQLIMQELLDMRSDERDCQNQILQVLSVAGTFIGILFGGGFIFGGDLNKLNTPLFGDPSNYSGIKKIIATYATTSRIIFLLNSIIFCVAISYILKLAISDTIRYFHVQDLQERAWELMDSIGGCMDKNELILWDEYRMTVMTMNPRHLTNAFAALHFVTYNISMTFLILLCLVMTVIQYSLLRDKQWYDNIGLIIVGTTSIFCLFMALYTSTRDSKSFVKEINDNVLARRDDKTQGNEIVHNILYLLYPRLTDLQKPLLIVGGAVSAYILGKCRLNWDLIVMLHRLFWTIIIFDFFIYQSRFLLNDIRGFEEDDHSENSKKLIVNKENKLHYIKVSIIDVFARTGLAFLLLIALHDKLRPVIQIGNRSFNALEIEILILLIITILYEVARSFKKDWGVYILVGFGYPLRILVGFMSAYPDVDPIKMYPVKGFALFLVGMYFMGVYSSLLAWVYDTITIRIRAKNTMGFKKHYYNDLNKRIDKSYENAGKKKSIVDRDGFYPLREKGYLKELWHLAFLACYIMLSLSMLIVLEGPYKRFFIVLEIVIFTDLLLVAFRFSGPTILNGIRLSLLLMVLKIIILSVTFHIYKSSFIIISVFQVLVISIYYVQRYTPRILNFKEFAELVAKFVIGILFTKSISNQMFVENRND